MKLKLYHLWYAEKSLQLGFEMQIKIFFFSFFSAVCPTLILDNKFKQSGWHHISGVSTTFQAGNVVSWNSRILNFILNLANIGDQRRIWHPFSSSSKQYSHPFLFPVTTFDSHFLIWSPCFHSQFLFRSSIFLD